MRSRLISPLAILSCLAFVAAPPAAHAQPLADRLPADTVVYVGWAGADGLGSQYKDSHLKALLEASNFPKFIDDFLPKVIERARQEEPELRDALAGVGSFGPFWHRPCALAFGGFDLNNADQPIPRFLFVCNAPGKDGDALRKQFDAMVQQGLRAAGADAPQGTPIKSFRAGDLVGLSTGYDQPEKMVAGGGNALSNSAAFKATIARVGKEPALALYVDAEAAIKQVNQAVEKSGNAHVSETWPRVREALGLDGLKRVVFAQGFDGKDWGTQCFVEAPAPRKGLVAMLDAGPVSDEMLKVVPATSTLAGVSRFDFARLIDEVRGAIEKVDENAAAQFDAGLNQLQAVLAMDVKRDLLAALGDEWAYYTDPMTGGRGAMGFVIVNHLRDAEKVEQSLNRIGQLAQGIAAQQGPDAKVNVAIRQTKAGDVTVKYVASPMFTPSWAIHGGNLYFGIYPQVVASAAAHASRGGGLLDNKDFVALRQRLLAGAGGGARASSVQFMDLPKTAPSSYQTWLLVSSLARFGDVMGIESPAMLFPTMDVLMQHLSPAGSVSWTDDAGWHMRAVSPFPGSTLLAADTGGMMSMQSSALMASILLPSLNRAREQANRVKSASNLRQIGQGVMMFANENKGKFPREIGQLPATQDLTADVFVNPRKGTSSPPRDANAGEAAAAWVRQNSDYEYVGAGKDYRAATDEIVAYEKPDGLSDGINILFADGHVEFVQMEMAKQSIQQGKLVAQPAPGQPARRPPGQRQPGQRQPGQRPPAAPGARPAPRPPGSGI